jgi:hypothetical protein
MAVVIGLAHHGDDLFDRRRVGGIELPLVAWRTPGVVTGHRRGRATPTGGIEHGWDGHGISSRSHSGTRSPLPYRRSRIPSGIAIALSLRLDDASAGGSSARRPTLVRSGRLPNVV